MVAAERFCFHPLRKVISGTDCEALWVCGKSSRPSSTAVCVVSCILVTGRHLLPWTAYTPPVPGDPCDSPGKSVCPPTQWPVWRQHSLFQAETSSGVVRSCQLVRLSAAAKPTNTLQLSQTPSAYFLQLPLMQQKQCLLLVEGEEI